MSVHHWVLGSCRAVPRQSISEACESGQRAGLHPAWGDTCPPPADPCLLGKLRQPTERGPGEKLRPQFGVHGPSAKLRRRDRPQMPSPSGPSPPRVCRERRRKARRGHRRGPACLLLPPSSLATGWEAPKVLAGLASEGGVQATVGDPGPGGGGGSSTGSPGPRAGASGRGRAQGAPCRHVDRWAGGREVLCQFGREGRKEGEWTRGEGGSGGCPLGPTHVTVTGHRAGWRHTLTAISTDGQTDRQTCTLRPPGGLPAQPRSPRPGRTTSRGECGGPAG